MAISRIVIRTTQASVIKVLTRGLRGESSVNVPLLPYSSANPPAGYISFVGVVSGVSPNELTEVFIRFDNGAEKYLTSNIK